MRFPFPHVPPFLVLFSSLFIFSLSYLLKYIIVSPLSSLNILFNIYSPPFLLRPLRLSLSYFPFSLFLILPSLRNLSLFSFHIIVISVSPFFYFLLSSSYLSSLYHPSFLSSTTTNRDYPLLDKSQSSTYYIIITLILLTTL